MKTDTQLKVTYTQNVIAESLYGSTETVIVVGSHLDSVTAGPGINDNGSGSAANLEMAISFAPERTVSDFLFLNLFFTFLIKLISFLLFIF